MATTYSKKEALLQEPLRPGADRERDCDRLGYLSPDKAAAMKPLGDAFIRLITMIIAVVIFCTVVSGIAGMEI